MVLIIDLIKTIKRANTNNTINIHKGTITYFLKLSFNALLANALSEMAGASVVDTASIVDKRVSPE